MLINLPTWWSKTCLEARCCLIRECCHRSKTSGWLDLPAPCFWTLKCPAQRFPRQTKRWWWCEWWFSQRSDRSNLDILWFFDMSPPSPLFFLPSSGALLWHQFCTQGQLNLNSITMSYSWQHSDPRLSLLFAPTPPFWMSGEVSVVLVSPGIPHWKRWTLKKLPAAKICISSSALLWSGGKNERRGEKRPSRFLAALLPQKNIPHFHMKEIFSKPEQRVKMTNTNNYKKLPHSVVFLTAASGLVRVWFVA